MAFPLPLRAALRLPLIVVILTALLVVLLVTGAARRWWRSRIRPRDAAVTVALLALVTHLAAWHVIAWGF